MLLAIARGACCTAFLCKPAPPPHSASVRARAALHVSTTPTTLRVCPNRTSRYTLASVERCTRGVGWWEQGAWAIRKTRARGWHCRGRIRQAQRPRLLALL